MMIGLFQLLCFYTNLGYYYKILFVYLYLPLHVHVKENIILKLFNLLLFNIYFKISTTSKKTEVEIELVNSNIL